MNKKRHVVVQVGKCDSVLCTHRLSDDNLVDVVKLIPVFVAHVVVLDQGFKFRTTRNGHVESLCCEEALRIEQVEEVIVNEIRQQLVGQSVKRRHLRQRQIPLTESRAVDISIEKIKVFLGYMFIHKFYLRCSDQIFNFVKPVVNARVFFGVQIYLDCFQRLDI